MIPLIRVFPRKNNMTPDDSLAFYTGPPFQFVGDYPVHVSCTFTYDKPRAENLAEQWKAAGYEVEIGGPAYDDRGGEFVPGRYLKPGNVITSRGCNNHCWFCCVPNREGSIRELPVVDGFNVLDSNLLQCSEKHIREVFTMLKRQPEKPLFTGGLESAKLKDWHIDLLLDVKPKRMYFAYDDLEDYEPLVNAAKRLWAAGFSRGSHIIFCYVLMGFPKDTMVNAVKRLKSVLSLGMTPFAMLYRDSKGHRDPDWISLQAHWANVTKIYGKKKQHPMGLFE